MKEDILTGDDYYEAMRDEQTTSEPEGERKMPNTERGHSGINRSLVDCPARIPVESGSPAENNIIADDMKSKEVVEECPYRVVSPNDAA